MQFFFCSSSSSGLFHTQVHSLSQSEAAPLEVKYFVQRDLTSGGVSNFKFIYYTIHEELEEC